MTSVIFAYSFIGTASFLIFYVTLLVFEENYGNRFLSDVRLHIDNKIVDLGKYVNVFFIKGITVYEKGEDKIGEELLDPITTPVKEGKEHFNAIQSGHYNIKEIEEKKVSKHLKSLKLKK